MSESVPGLGKRIRLLRTKHGLTVVQAATRAGISQSAWTQIENSQNNPSLHTLVAISKVLRVKPGELLDGIEIKA